MFTNSVNYFFCIYYHVCVNKLFFSEVEQCIVASDIWFHRRFTNAHRIRQQWIVLKIKLNNNTFFLFIKVVLIYCANHKAYAHIWLRSMDFSTSTTDRRIRTGGNRIWRKICSPTYNSENAIGKILAS